MRTPLVVAFLHRVGWAWEDIGETCWVGWHMLRIRARRLKLRVQGKDPDDVEF